MSPFQLMASYDKYSKEVLEGGHSYILWYFGLEMASSLERAEIFQSNFGVNNKAYLDLWNKSRFSCVGCFIQEENS